MNNSIYDIIDRGMPFLFILSFIAMVLLMFQLFLHRRSRVKAVSGTGYASVRSFPVKGFVFFIGTILTLILLSSVLKGKAQEEIQSYFDHLDPATASVQVKGVAAVDPAAVLQALRIGARIPAHHTHPVNRIYVLITGKNGNLALRLGRDSGNPQEYWVFYPRYFYLSHNEVYRINTVVFDKY